MSWSSSQFQSGKLFTTLLKSARDRRNQPKLNPLDLLNRSVVVRVMDSCGELVRGCLQIAIGSANRAELNIHNLYVPIFSPVRFDLYAASIGYRPATFCFQACFCGTPMNKAHRRTLKSLQKGRHQSTTRHERWSPHCNLLTSRRSTPMQHHIDHPDTDPAAPSALRAAKTAPPLRSKLLTTPELTETGAAQDRRRPRSAPGSSRSAPV